MIDYDTPKRSFFQYILYVIFKRKWLLTWTFFLFLGSFFLLSYISWPMYQGIAKVWVHKSTNQQISFIPEIQIPNITVGLFPTAINWIESLTGQTVAMELAEVFHLDDFYRLQREDPQGFREKFWYYFKWPIKQVMMLPVRIMVSLGFMEQPEFKRDYLSYAAGKVFKSMIVVELSNQMSDVMAISVYGPTRELAEDMANYLADVLIERAVKGEQSVARFAVDFAEEQIGDIEQKLADAENALKEYQKEMGVLNINQQKQLQVSMADGLENQIQTLETSAEELRKKVEVLDQQIKEQGTTFVSTMVLQKNVSDKQEAVLNLAMNQEKSSIIERQIDETHKRARELIEAESVSNRLQREIQIYSNILMQFRDKLAKLKIETVSRLKAASMEVVDPAYIPESEGPSWPMEDLNIILGIILGLGTGLLIAFLIEYFNDGLRNELEVQKELNLPVFGTVPEFDFESEP